MHFRRRQESYGRVSYGGSRVRLFFLGLHRWYFVRDFSIQVIFQYSTCHLCVILSNSFRDVDKNVVASRGVRFYVYSPSYVGDVRSHLGVHSPAKGGGASLWRGIAPFSPSSVSPAACNLSPILQVTSVILSASTKSATEVVPEPVLCMLCVVYSSVFPFSTEDLGVKDAK